MLLILVAANAVAAVPGSTPSQDRGWIHWSRAASVLAARERAGAAARGPATTRLGRDRRPEPSGVIVWTGGGIQVCDTESNQFSHTLVSDFSGGVIVAWSDDRTPAYDIYAMRLDANGNRMWPASGVALCANDSMMFQPEAVPDGAGGAFVVF